MVSTTPRGVEARTLVKTVQLFHKISKFTFVILYEKHSNEYKQAYHSIIGSVFFELLSNV